MFDSLRQNFEIILVFLFLISAISYFIYRLSFYKNIKIDLRENAEYLKNLTKKEQKKFKYNVFSKYLNTFPRKVIYFFADLFWVLLFVLVLRGFIYEPFIIPSSSMKPGLIVGDIILVNKYTKGLRMPVTNSRLTNGEDVQRGDILVFKYPNNPKISYIKRVIGLPGDKVYYDNRNKMIINGEPVAQRKKAKTKDTVEIMGNQITTNFTVFQVDLSGRKFDIQYSDDYPTNNFLPREWVIPENNYLMLGDNRDNSSDGRRFGYLDDKLIIGKATHILFNFNCVLFKGKCDRFFNEIK